MTARGCRVFECTDPPTRFLHGKRRTFYCDRHGPSKLSDWDRLIPLSTLGSAGPAPETSERRSVAGLPVPIAAAVDHLVTALLDYARSPAVECPECPKLRAELTKARATIADLESLALEAMEYVPASPPGLPPGEPVETAPAPIELRPPGANGRHAMTEKPARAPRPPRPPSPPQQVNPNELLTDPLAVADPTEEEFRTLPVLDLLNKIPRGRNTPPLVFHTRMQAEWERLDLGDRRRAFHAFKRLAGGLKHVTMYALKERGKTPGSSAHSSFMLKAGQRLRILLTWEEGVGFVIERFVDRADRQFYTTE